MVHMCFTLKVLALDNGRWFLHTENLILVQLRLGRVLVAERTAQVLHGLKWLEYGTWFVCTEPVRMDTQRQEESRKPL
jgi:hypothetical protein